MRDAFNKDWDRTMRRLWVWGAINVIVVIGLIGFMIWVIVKVMAYFGVT